MRRNPHIPTSAKTQVKSLSSSSKTQTLKLVGKVDGKTVVASKPVKVPK